MKTAVWFICLLIYFTEAKTQPVAERIAKAVEKLQNDVQMKHAILGISVVRTENNENVFELNAQTGLAPASCQKTIISATAFELLGSDYRYHTILGYDGSINQGILKGNLHLIGSGDPTLGSWRYQSTKENKIRNDWREALKTKGIQKMEGDLIGQNGKWERETLPGGWIWDDIGNYYGAGTAALNWHENQYDLILQSGSSLGDKVSIVSTKPKLINATLESDVITAAKGSGDNSYIYLPPFAQKGIVRGTIPVDEKAFTISGSFPDPSFQLMATLNKQLDSANIGPKHFSISYNKELPSFQILSDIRSPTLDSINYWFMKKSINLYGEALVKTIAYEKTGLGSTDKGVELVKLFWKERGIEPSALRILDGSGLSPQNRVTVDALVKVLQYAKSRPWFNYYYDALPVYNQMKLKSGTIGGAKSFAGYHTAKDGTAYTVAMIINNYDGSASEIVRKMFLILDELK